MITDILEKLMRREIDVREAEALIRQALLRTEVLDNLVRLDVGRELRRAVPEIILAKGKPVELVVKTALKLASLSGRAIVSKAEKIHAEAIAAKAGEDFDVVFHEKASIVVVRHRGQEFPKVGGKVGIITAGSADVKVAEEAKVIVEELGCEVYGAYDAGVAGLHRLIEPLSRMLKEGVDVLIVAAGREGALPAVVAGLVDIPVIGLPVSTGEGLGGSGVAALLSMLQSCSLGLAVVNIDGGVAAGVVAALIARRAALKRHREGED